MCRLRQTVSWTSSIINLILITYFNLMYSSIQICITSLQNWLIEVFTTSLPKKRIFEDIFLHPGTVLHKTLKLSKNKLILLIIGFFAKLIKKLHSILNFEISCTWYCYLFSFLSHYSPFLHKTSLNTRITALLTTIKNANKVNNIFSRILL